MMNKAKIFELLLFPVRAGPLYVVSPKNIYKNINKGDAMFTQSSTESVSFLDLIVISEGNYHVRILRRQGEFEKAYRLRHHVFAENLRWVPEKRDKLEQDSYDSFAIHFGVFDLFNNLLAYVRLITANNPFMIEREFRCVIGELPFRKNSESCELTRFCVAPEARNNRINDSMPIAAGATPLLFKGVYQFCFYNKIRFVYGVTDGTIHRYLTMKGYPYKGIGSPKIMPDGVIAHAVLLDWQEFETMHSVNRPHLLAWYRQNLITPLSRAMTTE